MDAPQPPELAADPGGNLQVIRASVSQYGGTKSETLDFGLREPYIRPEQFDPR